MVRPVVGILPLLLMVASLRELPLQAATVGPVAPINCAPQATAVPQGPGTDDAPVPASTGTSAAKTAQQWMAEGLQAQKAGKQVDAIRDFLNAQRLEPASPDPLYSLGMSFFLIGWYENDTSYYDRAARHFDSALALDPQHDRAVFMLGMMEVVHFRLKEAEPYFLKAISLKPRNPYYRLHYGILLGRMNKTGDAIQQMLLAEKLDPTYPQSPLDLGQLYAQLGKYADARTHLERAVRLDPNLASAYYSLGGVYRHLGLTAESKSAYEIFQRLRATQPQADPVVDALQGGSGGHSK